MTDVKTLHIDNLCVDELARGQHIWKMLYAKEDAAGGEKHTLLNMIETLYAKLKGLQNLQRIDELVESINTNTKQNGQLVESFNSVLSALQSTMDNINSIAENNKDLMSRYNELTSSVAEALKGVKDAVGNSANANASLTAAITALTGTQDKIQKLLDEIKDKLPERKEGESGTSTEALNGIYTQLESLACSIRVMQREPIKQNVLQGLTNHLNQTPLKLPPPEIITRNSTEQNTLIDLFCAPFQNCGNDNIYVSMLTCLLSACLQTAYPFGDGNFEYQKTDSDFTLEAFCSANDTLRKIQQKINQNTDIQKLNNLLKDIDQNAFIILLNSFDWSCVSKKQDEEDVFIKKDSITIASNNLINKKASITYKNNMVEINEAAIPIIKKAFTALINIVFEAWELKAIKGSYNRL